jgi:outer membrane protein assembly factor BamB
VYCLDANTGKELWQHSYPCSAKDPNQRLGTRATPTVDGKLVYTVSRDGHLFCLNTADGKVAWSKSYSKDFGGKVPTWGFSGSALVEGNMLIVEPGGPRASLVALDKASGGVIWRAGDDPASYSSPIAYTYAGQRCVAVFTAKGLVSRRVADGKELWRHPWKTSWDVNAATPIVLGDKLFISSGYNSGCALIQFSSNPIKVLWQNKNMCNHVNSCVFWRGHVYGFDESRLRCLDFQTGRVKWTERSPGKGSLMMADGKLVVYSDQGRVAIAEASSERYKELSGAQVLEGRDTWAPPVLANGKLYCRSQEDLVCLDVQGK